VTVENLTRDEARERARILNVASYDVHLDLTAAITDSPTFPSTSVVRFTCSEPGATPHIDLTADRIVEATLNGQPIDTSAFTGRRLILPALAESNELRIVADCLYVRTGEGLHRFIDPVDKETYLYTQFETFDAHRMFACFDQPDLKASFTFTVDAPTHWLLASNMSGGKDTSRRDVTRWSFDPTPRQSSYVTCIVAGPYFSTHDEHDGLPLGIYCRQSLAQHLDADEIFQITKQGFDFFHREFGYRYPWPKYDQLFVPEFNFGAMENPGCVTFTEDYVFRSKVTDVSRERRAVTILHEMAHMWFGDLVTMRWWDDLWLNESFAEYVSTVATAEATKWPDAWATFCNTEKAWAYRQDQLPTTHPVAADIPDIEAVSVNFDGITYAKGASVLKQLAHYVSREAFFTAMRGYFRRHAFGNTTLQDLLDALTEASGRDLSTWCKEWLQSAGVNTLRAQFDIDDDHITSFYVLQEAPEDHSTLRAHRLRIGLYDRTSEGLLRREQIEVEIAGNRTEVPQLVGHQRADLVLVNDDDLTYAKIRLDDASLRTLLEHIGELHEPLARALCWYAAWDMTRDAEMRPGDFLDLVIAGAHLESGVQTVQSLLLRARSAIDPYGDPAQIAERQPRLADAAHALMRTAAPGHDIQLAAARALAANATSAEHLALLAGLLDGTASVDGLVVDADLRWTLLHRLVVLGSAGEDAITNELDRDDTAAGRRHAMRLRASIPTAAAKAEAWQLATEDESLSNAEQNAVIAGFQQPEHRELLRPYADRYFDVVGSAWERRTAEMAEHIAVGLYPHQIVEQQVIDATDDYLRTKQPPPTLRRLIVENRDQMARALRTQAFDQTR